MSPAPSEVADQRRAIEDLAARAGGEGAAGPIGLRIRGRSDALRQARREFERGREAGRELRPPAR